MANLVWDSALATGDPEIDGQHRELIKQAGEMFAATSRPDARQVLNNALGFFESYVKHHFQVEENRMRKSGYPAILFHIGEHNYFRNELNLLTRQIRDSDASAPLQGLHLLYALIADWFINHIRITDMELADYLRHPVATAEIRLKQ